MIHYDKSYKLICHMTIFQVIYKYSKNQVDPKEDTEKAYGAIDYAVVTVPANFSNEARDTFMLTSN